MEARGDIDPSDLAPAVAGMVTGTLRQIGRAAADDMRRRRSRTIEEHRRIRVAFERRLCDVWGPALDALEAVWIAAYEAGEALNAEEHRNPPVDDPQLEVLVRLHARACLTVSEILALFRSGHASGALARWRTLHELAVVALFIRDHDRVTAERYIVHADVRIVGRLDAYQRHAEALGEERLTAEEERAIRNRRTEVLASVTNPRAFATPWGWAGEAVGKARPDFGDLQSAVHLERWQPFVDLAHYPVHAGSSALTFALGNDGDYLLAGPSNAGLAEIGPASAISLQLATVALLMYRPTPMRSAALLAIAWLVEDAGKAFDTGEAEHQRQKAEGPLRSWRRWLSRLRR